MNWCSRQESHLQPPRSKRGALIIVPREQKGRRKIAESRRSRVVRTTPGRLKDFSIRFLPSKLKWGRRSDWRAATALRAKRYGRAQAPEPHRHGEFRMTNVECRPVSRFGTNSSLEICYSTFENGGSPRIRTVFSPVK